MAQAWDTLITAIFGPIVGALVAFIGHSLNDATILHAITFATSCQTLNSTTFRVEKSPFVNCNRLIAIPKIKANTASAITQLHQTDPYEIASLGDILLFREPATRVFLQGFVATGVNFVSTLILGTIILAAYNKTQVKRGSLAKED